MTGKKKNPPPTMGRKASFRDTTQIDRPQATLSFYRNVINVRFYGRMAFFRKLGSVFHKGRLPRSHLSRLSLNRQILLLSPSSHLL